MKSDTKKKKNLKSRGDVGSWQLAIKDQVSNRGLVK